VGGGSWALAEADVAADGTVGPDWANIRSPTTTVGLSGTTVKTATDVETDTVDIQSRIGSPVSSLAADGLSRFQKLCRYIWLSLRKDTFIATDFATELSEINADNGSGIGAYANTTDSDEARRDNVGTAGAGLTAADDAVIAAIAALNNLSSAQAQTAAAAALTAYDPPTRAELTTDINSVIALLPDDIAEAIIKKNTAYSNFTFMMFDTAGDPATGKTVTATRSIDGAAFASCANAVSEISSGWYKINLAAADLNGDNIALKFTATGCAPTNCSVLPES